MAELRTMVLVAALLPLAAVAAEPFQWPALGAQDVIESTGTLESNGVPVRVRALRLRMEPARILQAYTDAFARAGLWIPPQREIGAAWAHPTIVAVDPERKLSYTVILERSRKGLTTVLLGEANLAAKGSSDATFAPLFPGATAVMTHRSEGDDVVSYEAPARRPEVQRFYADVLGKGGWQVSPDEDDTWRRGGEELKVVLREKGDRTSALVMHRRR